MRITVRDPDRRAVERFCRELAPLVTSGPPGIAGYAAGRPVARPAFGYWPALLASRAGQPRRRALLGVHVVSQAASISISGLRPRRKHMTMDSVEQTVRLGDLAHARSGDKGNTANIGVVAHDEASFNWLRIHLTESVVADYLKPLGHGTVRRHELRNLHAFNFVIDRALSGGASRSLRLDTQGKTLGVVLLELRLPAPLLTPDLPEPAAETSK